MTGRTSTAVLADLVQQVPVPLRDRA
jgi:hypothetical protein